MAKPSPTISDAELEVLRSLWEHGPGTIREIGIWLRAHKRRWAYTTVQTLLNRLAAKGYVACDRKGVPHVFRPAVSRDGIVKQRLRAVADQLCEGAASPLVMALVSSHRFSKEEIRQFRQLLDEVQPREGETPVEPRNKHK
jgi:predicted transcriptional regulator